MSVSSNKITTGVVVGPEDSGLFSTKMTSGVIVGRKTGAVFSTKMTIGVIVGPLPKNARRRQRPIING